MRVLAKVTLVVNKKEYAPDTEVEIPDDTEAKSLIKRGFASAVGKKENKTEIGSKSDIPPKTDKNATKSTKSNKNTQKTENKTKKEIDNNGSAVSQSGGQPV
uniref:Uncharacterized protein n=1 Tax=Siphoviridae sp. ctpbe1 TaxID=2826466 RepID=A0A8S5NPT8_9CAUD|nr:MAG TPA: hypothetical protein [Siphoviridae sp. ctpbe1]